MKPTTARRFGSFGKSFVAPAAAAATIGAALIASGTSDTADTVWSPAAAALLPDVLPVAGTLLSYGGSRQLAAGGTVTHSGAFSLPRGTNSAPALTFGPSAEKVGFWSQAGNYLNAGINGTTSWQIDSSADLVALRGVYLTSAKTSGVFHGTTGPTVDARADGGFRSRNLANSADADLTAATATLSGNVSIGASSTVVWATRGNLRMIAADQFRFTSTDNSRGFVLSSATDNTAALLSRDGSADAALTCGAITASGTGQCETRFTINSTVFGNNLRSLISSSTSASITFSPIGNVLKFGPGNIISTEGQIFYSVQRGAVFGRTTGGPTAVVSVSSGVDSPLIEATVFSGQTKDPIIVWNSAQSSKLFSVSASGAITASGFATATGTQSTLVTKDSHYLTHTRLLSSGRMGYRVTASGSDVCFVRYNDSGITAEIGSGHASGSTEIWAGGSNRLTIASNGAITASSAIQETPTQSVLDPTTTNIPTGKRQGWYNSALSEFRDWVNIGGTLLKSAAYT